MFRDGRFAVVQVQAVYLVLVAAGLFAVGALWGKGLVWRLVLAAGYALWRSSGGMRRLLDRHDAADLRQVFGMHEVLAWLEGEDATFWAYVPPIMPGEGELGKGEVFVGDRLPIADFYGHEAFCKELGVEIKDSGVALMSIVFFHVFTYRGDVAEMVCHRRMSLPMIAYAARVMGLPCCPVCGGSFENVTLRAPEYMERRARLRVKEAIAQVRGGKDGVFKCFALQHREVEASAVCLAKDRRAELHVFFGDASALELWSERRGTPLRPLTLEVVVPRKI